MTKLWPAFLLLGACLVGDGSIDDGDPTVGPADPENPNAVRCSSGFTVAGQYTQGAPRPADVGGCWPVGTWTFTATIDTAATVLDIDGDGVGDTCGAVAGTSAPTLEGSYSFTVTRIEDTDAGGAVEQYAYNGSSPNFVSVKVSEGGGGDCQGGMEFANADKTMWWNFNPTICTSDETRPGAPADQLRCGEWGDRGILGAGEFTHYLEPREY